MSRLFIYDENMTDERAKITVAKMAAISDIVAPEKEYIQYLSLIHIYLKTDLVKPIGEELKPVISDVIKEVKGKIPEVKTLVLAVVSKVKDFISFKMCIGDRD